MKTTAMYLNEAFNKILAGLADTLVFNGRDGFMYLYVYAGDKEFDQYQRKRGSTVISRRYFSTTNLDHFTTTIPAWSVETTNLR